MLPSTQYTMDDPEGGDTTRPYREVLLVLRPPIRVRVRVRERYSSY